MKFLAVIENTNNIVTVNIGENESVLDLKKFLQIYTHIPYHLMDISVRNQKVTNPNMAIKDLEIKEDIVVISKREPQPIVVSSGLRQSLAQSLFGSNFSILDLEFRLPDSQIPNQTENYDIKKEVQELKKIYQSNPEGMKRLFQTNALLATAIYSGADNIIEEYIKDRIKKTKLKYQKEKEEYEKLRRNQNDPNIQKKIEEYIKQKNIDENYKFAQEYFPQTLFSIHMLYINLEVNKMKIIALVDTGAESTIISKRLAVKCNLMNLCDTRFQTIAHGIGISKIIGVIHAAQIKIENQFLMAKLSVIENDSVGFIFGLDNMRGHGCVIDVNKNALVFPFLKIETKFLSDAEAKTFKFKEYEILETELIEKAKQDSMQHK